MKKMYLVVAIIILSLAGTSLMGQTTVGQATVGATVNAVLSVANNSNINFGSVQSTAEPILDPEDNNTQDVGTYAFGEFTISGTNSAQIILNYDPSATLTNGGTGSLTFTPNVASNTTGTIGDGVTLRATGAAFPLDVTSGDVYLYVGGTLGSFSGQEVGTYTTSAPWEFTVEYQ